MDDGGEREASPYSWCMKRAGRGCELTCRSSNLPVEQGTHTELLARQGYYAHLYQKQLLEEAIETT